MNDVFLKRNHLVFINLCSKYWVCARLCSGIGTTGIRKTKPLLSQDSSCGERRQESSQRRHSCSRSRVRWRNRIWVEGMEGQAPSPRKWTRGGGKGVGCQVSFSTRPPFPGSVCTRPPLPCPHPYSPLRPPPTPAAGQFWPVWAWPLCDLFLSGTWGSRQGGRVWFHKVSSLTEMGKSKELALMGTLFCDVCECILPDLRAVCF